MAFGIMNKLTVAVFDSPTIANEMGYNAQENYKNTKPIEIEQVVIVRNGTMMGHSTVDIILKDQEGNEFVVMVTGNLLKGLPL